MDIDERLRTRDGGDDRMTIIHPTGEILHILVDAGVPHDRLHDAQRRIAAAYREANEGRTATEEAACPARS